MRQLLLQMKLKDNRTKIKSKQLQQLQKQIRLLLQHIIRHSLQQQIKLKIYKIKPKEMPNLKVKHQTT